MITVRLSEAFNWVLVLPPLGTSKVPALLPGIRLNIGSPERRSGPHERNASRARVSIMLSLGKLQPPADPPEKWKAVRAALEDDDKTRRLTRLLLVNSIPFVVCMVCFLVLAAVALIIAMHR